MASQEFQYGSGGYVNDPPADALDTSGPSSGGKQKKDYSTQSLLPVTIKQLLNAETGVDDTPRVDGHELSQITVVGLILSVQEQTTNMTISVDDGTGRIEVRFWIASEDQQQIAEQKALLRDGVYVRIVGNLRLYMDNKSIAGHRIIPIKNYNEITHHFLECVYAHLSNTKGPLPSATPAGQAAGSSSGAVAGVGGGGGAGLGMGMGMGGMGGNNQYGAAQSSFNTGYATGLNDLHSKVLETISTSPSAGFDRGVHVNEVISKLASIANGDQIKQAIDFLTDQGHIFNTVDDDHVKCTSA